MTNKGGTRKNLGHRLATIMAAVGALLISSGIVLMVTPTSASAGDKPERLKDWVCKYVGTPGIDEHLKKGNGGLVWVSAPATEGTWFNDAHGRSFVLAADAPRSPKPSASQCPAGDVAYATASVDFVDPTCENDNVASYRTDGEHVTFKAKVKVTEVDGPAVTAAAPVAVEPGSTVTIKAKADHGFRFENGDKVMFFEHEFGLAQVNCTEVTPVAPTFVDPTCTTAAGVTLPTSTTVTYAQEGTAAAGATVGVGATLVDPETSHFADGATTTWSHTFTTPTGCTGVLPPTTPTVSPPKALTEVKGETATTTPTVVEAGLAGDTAGSSGAGLGLVAAGLLLLAGAGGMVLRRSSDR